LSQAISQLKKINKITVANYSQDVRLATVLRALRTPRAH